MSLSYLREKKDKIKREEVNKKMQWSVIPNVHIAEYS